MTYLADSDLSACLSVQPRRADPATSIITQDLASELRSLVNDDSAKAMAILRELIYYNLDKPLNWYYEKAIDKLSKLYSTI